MVAVRWSPERKVQREAVCKENSPERKRSQRLDKLLVDKGFVQSREKARAIILGGMVMVGDRVVDKGGSLVNPDSHIRVKGSLHPYVSRGGLKLEEALRGFQVYPKGKVAMDVGASTGGFTDCLLQKGAKRVYAVDVGYGQLAWKLRNDPRVVNLERKNIRYLKTQEVGEKVDLVVIDTSFISVAKFLRNLLPMMMDGGEIVALLKPQFEVGRGEVGKGGVVRERLKHQQVLDRISHFSESIGLKVRGTMESPLLGPKGNKEFFIHLEKNPKA
jgi:23S rRNA (cytidine1920-2'-O)/16S rRNA (cytidine1409-2'-O)-methyltransferase